MEKLPSFFASGNKTSPQVVRHNFVQKVPSFELPLPYTKRRSPPSPRSGHKTRPAMCGCWPSPNPKNAVWQPSHLAGIRPSLPLWKTKGAQWQSISFCLIGGLDSWFCREMEGFPVDPLQEAGGQIPKPPTRGNLNLSLKLLEKTNNAGM